MTFNVHSNSYGSIGNRLKGYTDETQKTTILNNVYGRVACGQLLAIMGPSGSGKTCLLNILSGRLVAPRRQAELSGYVAFGGKTVDHTTFQRISAFVSQEDSLFSQLSVQETISFSAKFHMPLTTKSHDIDYAVDELLNSLGIVEF